MYEPRLKNQEPRVRNQEPRVKNQEEGEIVNMEN
jgi:hypothetical protein